MAKIRITNAIELDEDELQEKFVKSSGPGGQNVNKVSTAVQLRFDIKNSPNLPSRVRQKILKSGDSRLTKEGQIIIIAESKRTQEANRKDAFDRLKKLINEAAFVPKPRLATRPTLASKKRRLESKTKRAQTKKMRSGKINFD